MRALLDACVLYPTVMREVLLGVAQKGLFTPLWSPRILEEWARAARKIGLEGETIARGEIVLVQAAWPKAEYEPRGADMSRLWLPDENDIHVLAAAIAGSADVIVTSNAKDFPRATLRDEGVDRVDPDRFLLDLFGRDQASVADSAEDVRRTAEHLSGIPQDLRRLLKKARLPRLGKALASYSGETPTL